MICRLSFIVLGCLVASTAAATEHEVATYGDILMACYEASEDGAHAACQRKMAQACMETEEGGYTTLGMVHCTMAETRVCDRYLNREYQATLAGLEAMDADEAVYFPEFAKRVENLRAAQRAWIVFRDAECGLAYAMWGSGSMRNIASVNCQLDMTVKRTLEIRDLGSEMR